MATLVTGHLVGRVGSRYLTAAAMVMLSTALVWAVLVAPGWSAIGLRLALGTAGASIRALEAASVPNYFGTVHLGAIRGFVASVSVGSTAIRGGDLELLLTLGEREGALPWALTRRRRAS